MDAINDIEKVDF